MKYKILRVTTVPIYMNIVLKGQLKHLNQYFDVIAATSFDDKNVSEIREREGIKIYKVDLNRTIKPWQDIKALLQLIKLIRKERPILVHSHTPKAGLLTMLAAYLTRVPIRIHTVTGLPLMGAKGIKKKFLIVIEKITYFLATCVYPNSHSLKNYILENDFVNTKKLKVLYNGSTNGVDIEFFDPIKVDAKEKLRSIYKIDLNAFVFLFVGRIAKEKGIEELFSAFKKLIEQFPENSIKLVLIGKFERQYGTLTFEIEHLIDKHPDVISLGRFDDVRPFYKLADVFVLPSYREGFPNAVLEAGAMGLPSIVTNINGCNEVIADGENGYIIPVKDECKLLDAMKKMMCKKEVIGKMGVTARKIICEKYDRKNILEAIKSEYELLLKNSGNDK
ncbi:glycosyltransferase family 4 protein [Flavobacterium sp.]|jgi:glycosyltransferase involved in cell wall biosynthesis|uniref:glycosyltransferase family 4 protein n=1 Tax=Flavobacterium sp. TaxID=239 RepID=UPI0037BECCB4